VTPFAYTMGFVDSDARKLFLGVDDSEYLAEVVALTELWSDVEQASERMATLEVLEDPGPVGWWSGTVDGLYSYVGIAHGCDLVVLDPVS
jgi:hypothetical protein